MGHVIDIEKVELVKTTIIIILFWICGGKVTVSVIAYRLQRSRYMKSDS